MRPQPVRFVLYTQHINSNKGDSTMTFILERQIDSLKTNATQNRFNQICAIRWLREDLKQLTDEQSAKENPTVTEAIRRIRRIALCIEDTQIPDEVCGYLIEYTVILLTQIRAESSDQNKHQSPVFIDT